LLFSEKWIVQKWIYLDWNQVVIDLCPSRETSESDKPDFYFSLSFIPANVIIVVVVVVVLIPSLNVVLSQHCKLIKLTNILVSSPRH
jgi:hypothetical protein